jgi:prepilin-type N-terminal cleavage/methylation domain-containing protein
MLKAFREQRGFTLAELLVVTAIIGMVMGAIFTLQQQGQQAYLLGSNRIEAQQNARVALDLITRDLRTALSVTSIPSGQDITFVDENGNSIRYSLSGTTLNRTDPVNGAIPLMGGVQSLTFTYYSAYDGSTNTGTTTGVPGSVRVVKVQIQTQTENPAMAAFGQQRVNMECMIQLRNV